MFLSVICLERSVVGSSWCLINLVVKIIVGVGVEWPLAWLMTYRGVDCSLWSHVYRVCVESELCSKATKILMNELSKHRCFGYAPK